MWAKCGLILYICNMATINYIIQSKNNLAGIYIRLRDGRSIDLKAKTNFVISPSDWNHKKGQPINLKDSSNKQLNHNLSLLEKDLLVHYNNQPDKSNLNSQWLKEFINPKPKIEQTPSKLVEYIAYYTKYKKNSLGSSTYKRNNVYKRLIERFQVETKKEYLIKDVNSDFKIKFEEYCSNNGYANNTTARTMKFIKTICYHARVNGIETHFQIDLIKTKLEKVEKIYLTPENLQKIESTIFEHDYLNNAKDWLLISCETGQRVSDFLRFNKQQIRIEGNVHLIEFTQVKTNKIMAVPLSKKVQSILQKRDGNFPRKISDQKYNTYIKEVCKLSGINEKIKGSKINSKTIRKEIGIFEKWELVSSHIGRRSFASNNYGRIPTSLLIGATGHSTEKMFLEYIGKSETQKAMQLADYI
jgi:integrase